MQQTEHRSFEQPDETRDFPHGRAEIVKIGDEAVVTVDWFGASSYAK